MIQCPIGCPKPCPHSRLAFLGIQEIPGGNPLRLYNCEDCHTTVGRHGYFRTEEEIDKLLRLIRFLELYLSDKDMPITEHVNFDRLESLINEVSRARTPEFWR